MQMVFCLLVALLYVGGVAADEPLALHMPDAPPLTLYHDERGHGMVGDITLAAITLSGRTARIVDEPWARAQVNVASGQNQLIIPLSRTPEREQRYTWIVPIMPLERAFFSLDEPVNSFAQARQRYRRIGVGLGTAQVEILRREGFADEQIIQLNWAKTRPSCSNAGVSMPGSPGFRRRCTSGTNRRNNAASFIRARSWPAPTCTWPAPGSATCRSSSNCGPPCCNWKPAASARDCARPIYPRSIDGEHPAHAARPVESIVHAAGLRRLEQNASTGADCDYPAQPGDNMDVVKTLKPGKPGTKRLQERYGEQLVAVRYRLDRKTNTHYTTVELIVEQKYALYKTPPPAPTPPVALRIFRHENDLQRLIRSAGGKWDRENQVWLIERSEAERLGLAERIIWT